ncbi:MAG: molybdopterin molybdenumtransferase MoeA, partial [Flavobacterium sp.]
FYIYVAPAVKNKMGFAEIHKPKIVRKLNSDIKNNTGKTLFLKAKYDETVVTVLDGQSSAMLNTFAIANSLLIVPENVENYKKDQEVVLLPID